MAATERDKDKVSFSPTMEDPPVSPTVLPWDRFSNWLHCACVVTFDLELGQAMELIYPGHVKLTDAEDAWVTRNFISVYDSVQSDNAYYYGFVYFRQTKDKSIRRGYFQKSVVLISRLPFIALFTQLVSIVAPEYFDNGEPSLEAACHDIDQWPPPIPGDTVNLPIFGTVLQVRIPSRSDKVLGQGQNKIPPVPLVVMASSPSVASMTVQSLIRPYFTIHDSEFKEYTTKTQAPPPVILGVTNPFFAKTLQHWPHIVRIGEMAPQATKGCIYKGIQTQRPVEAQNAILRRYFLELTQSFMIPLERYMASLMPLQRNISPHKGPPRLRPFDPEEFLKSLEHSGPQLTSGIKGDWEGLYKKFFRCQNFEGWYQHRQFEVNQKLQVLHMEALCEANLMEWIADKEEVEIVDLILRIRDKLNFATNNNIIVNAESISKLNKHMDSIISSLPDDLQSVLKS
ncbi:hypothetical protein KUTeg_020400 [Tegillarca granosa]|uniref:UDENN domain-containing protein n=1 Tax=Tegillarca granosa TaxID=220873 RepID=A0ABQ9E7S3_TEGGR|nr:hypothetical protein KUTeg_020400 [Tegillarca granosa]